MRKKLYRDFESAREFARSLGLKSAKEWNQYRKSQKKPEDIPTNPNNVYKRKGWISWGDWLDTGNIHKKYFQNFESAREFARSLNLKNQAEWFEFCKSDKKPNNIPTSPRENYKNKGWVSWGDWLGTGRVATKNIKFKNFQSAKLFTRDLKLKSSKEWRIYAKSDKRPLEIPANPDKVYKNEWIDWGDWLGTDSISTHKIKFMNFEDARKFARSLNLDGKNQWEKYATTGKRPKNIPAIPSRTYKNNWLGWGDFLGTGNVSPQNMEFRNFESARTFVQKLEMKNEHEWREYCKSGNKPEDIPQSPSRVYKDNGWQGMGDWLGTGNIAPQKKVFRDFESARTFVRKLGLKGGTEWRAYCKSGNKPEDIPRNPNQKYENLGWLNWGDWLGTGSVATRKLSKMYLSFSDGRREVRKIAKQYNIKNWDDWRNAVKKGLIPKNIPADPKRIYSKRRSKK